jgi:hypothetical protein
VRASVASVASAVPRDATAFFSSRSHSIWVMCVHYEAAWASIESGVPTLNAAGSFPLGYDLVAVAATESELALAEARLRIWCENHRLDIGRVAWIHDGALRPWKATEQPSGTSPPR